MATLADALRQHGAAYLAKHTLSTAQAKAWRGIVACRTAALGGQQLACGACGHSHWQYHSCRNRHCPQCGARAKDAWLQGRLAEVLSVPYAHLVFTLPHSLNALYQYPQGHAIAWADRHQQLYRHDWVVYAKTPLGGPVQVLEYLNRYAHRTAIGNERIKAITADEVVFTVRADDQGNKRTQRLQGAEFVRRFLLHILPSGIKRIRHYGVLASACKTHKLAQAKLALQMPAPNLKAAESAQAFMARVAKLEVMQCPCCKAHALKVVATLTGYRQLPAPGAVMAGQPRGPP